ncbi:EpsG family protein [Pseudoalteromonas sp. US3C1013]|uniref:EpsG family protein n=1 Tax=unclassified Pseudoalteromonas TaxID=194690 RepID=UPI003AB6F66A
MIWFFVSLQIFLGQIVIRKFFVSALLLLLTTLSAFRYYVGSDFTNYVILFDTAKVGNFVPVEPSFSLLSELLGSLGFNFQAIIVLYSVLTMLFIFMGLRGISKRHSFLSITLLFVYLTFYFPSMSIMRQALAAAIVFWATITFLYKNKYFTYFLFVLLASFFHFSAILFLFSYLLKAVKFSRVIYLLCIFIALLLGATVFRDILLNVMNVIGFSYKNHLNHEDGGTVSLVFIINTFILCSMFIFIIRNGVSNFNLNSRFLVNIIFFLIIVRMLSLEFVVFNRVGSIYTVFLPLFIYEFVYRKLKNDSRLIFMIFLIGLFFMNDFFRQAKDYSYYQYSINFCLIGEPCPIQLFGEQDPRFIRNNEEW